MSENPERGVKEDIERFYEILNRETMFYIYGYEEGSPEYREIGNGFSIFGRAENSDFDKKKTKYLFGLVKSF